MDPGAIERVLGTLRGRVPGVRALVVIGPDGDVVGHAAAIALDLQGFATEHAMLLRILKRTAADTALGPVREHIIVSDEAVVIARELRSGGFAVVVADPREHTGRLRFELKCGCGDLETTI